MKILILDDDKTRHKLFRDNFFKHNRTHVETVADAIAALKEQRFEKVFLDHDLGGNTYVESGGSQPTGYDVAVWMRDNLEEMPDVFVHSLNPAGADNIVRVIEEHPNGFATKAPFLWTINNT